MTQTASQSYSREVYWKRYQKFLPKRLQLGPDSQPSEEWWHWRGAGIHVDTYAVPAARLAVVLIHGAGGYGRLLAPFARMLTCKGYSVYAPDLPGYGLTQGTPEQTSYPSWVHCISDLTDHLAETLRLPVVLAGFSIGGFLAYMTAAMNPRVSGIIATTLADPLDPAVRRAFARAPSLALGLLLLPWIEPALGRVRVPVKWLSNMRAISNSSELVDVFIHDRVGAGNRVSISFLNSIFQARPTVEPQDFTRCPVLLAHPAQDKWTPPEISMPFFDRLGCEKELVLLEGCGHFPIEEPGLSQLDGACDSFLNKLAADNERNRALS